MKKDNKRELLILFIQLVLLIDTVGIFACITALIDILCNYL